MNRIKVQQKLWDVANGAEYFAVTYDGAGRPITYDPMTAPNIPPVSIRSNEVSEKFVIDNKHGQDQILKSTSWIFQLYLEWNVEVDLSLFDLFLMMHPPFIAESATEQSVQLLVLSKDVQHPVQQ